MQNGMFPKDLIDKSISVVDEVKFLLIYTHTVKCTFVNIIYLTYCFNENFVVE